MRLTLFLSRAAVLAAALTLSSIACIQRGKPRGTRTDQTTPVRGGTLRLATLSDLRMLDPAVAFDSETQPFLNFLFAGLVDYDQRGELVADLAERWEISADGKEYRFFLRHGVRMHDGNELTADDVKRSAERTLNPDTPFPALAFLERLEGLADYQAKKSDHISGVVVESSHVVTYRLTGPDATFLPVLALPFLRPVCRTAGMRYDENFSKQPCGAGPFKIGAWEPGRYLRVDRFDGYFVPGKPYLDAIEMRMDVPRLTQRFQIEKGELDFMYEFERPDWIYFRTHPEWSKYAFEVTSPSVYGEFMNVEMEPFTDKRVRQAVAAAINRPNLQRYMESLAKVTGHVIPPGIPGYEEEVPYAQTYDLARARALMAEAGYPYDPATGQGGYPEPIQYFAGEGDSAVRWAELLQYTLNQIGIHIEIKVVSFAQYLALTGRPRTVKMGFAGWNIDFRDPSDFFEPVFGSQAIAEEESQNHAFYRNPTLDALLSRAHVELDQSQRLAMYHEAEKIVCDDAPWALTYYPMRRELAQPWVRDYRPHPVWLLHFKDTWIDERGKDTHSAFFSLPRKGNGALGALLPSLSLSSEAR